jgi:hypothetical protein
LSTAINEPTQASSIESELPEILLCRGGLKQAEERFVASATWQDYGLIFPSEVGAPLDPDNFSRRLSARCHRDCARYGTPLDLAVLAGRGVVPTWRARRDSNP